ncbi:hypothetical protein DFH09DRAFT_1104968 [Mycena vulgaris]|nr:hypothetical protein DFH09DRAFT_1104968 [Mycena vulgaris]
MGPSPKPLEHARLRAVGNAARKQSGETNGDVQKVQENTGVVVSWNFVALISETYFGQADCDQGRQGRKIQKRSIQQALGVGSTSFAKAENAVHILKHYGEGGSSPVQAGMGQISLEVDKPKGVKVLYLFLVNWEKSHDEEYGQSHIRPRIDCIHMVEAAIRVKHGAGDMKRLLSV